MWLITDIVIIIILRPIIIILALPFILVISLFNKEPKFTAIKNNFNKVLDFTDRIL